MNDDKKKPAGEQPAGSGDIENQGTSGTMMQQEVGGAQAAQEDKSPDIDKLLSQSVKAHFTVSFGKQVGAVDPGADFDPRRYLSKEELIGLLTEHQFRDNKNGPYITRPMGKNGHRSDENAEPWALLPLDIDELQADEIDKLKRWCKESNLSGCLATTFSHRADLPKFRIWLFASRDILPSEHAFVHRAIARLVPFKLDPCMAKPSQPVFLPSCPAATKDDAFAQALSGEPLDIDRLLESAQDDIREEQQRREARLQGSTGTGVRQPGGLVDYFNNHFNLSELLQKHGYQRKGVNRYVAPGSKSKRAAVVLYDRSLISFHDHAHDPLAQRNKFGQSVVHDSFAAFCKLDHGDDFKSAFTAAEKWARAQGWEDAAAPLSVGDAFSSDRADWPEPLHPDALYGIAGEIVRLIEPESESDPAAILLHVLAWFGAAVGRGSRRGPYYRVESTHHFTNLFVILVGETAKARKGTAFKRVKKLFEGADDELKEARGLSSGEGLKNAVRDARTAFVLNKKTNKLDMVPADPGVSDKRLLVVEEEFAGVLKQGARAGNTLSAVIRCAWDGSKLSTLTKTDPIEATDPHIAIIGHIVADELRRELTLTECANGFANRFLYMAARRAQELPFGGNEFDANVLADFQTRLRTARSNALMLSEVRMTDEAKALWASGYSKLSAGLPGLIGAVTARAEAQCVRLALIYTLLDNASAIDLPHLRAALALWKRCEDSARFIFGNTLGDPVADAILRALRAAGSGGKTRTEISEIFGRHKSAEQIAVALDMLERRGLAHFEQQATAGRAAEVWLAGAAKEAN